MTPIKFIEGNINAEVYTNEILPFYKRHFFRQKQGAGILKDSLFDEEGKFFQQDGARPHTAKVSLAYIRANFPNFFHDWPGNSPDLNPIENLWAIVQSKVDEYPCATTTEGLRNRITTAWAQLDLTLLQNLANAFPKRLQALLDKNI